MSVERTECGGEYHHKVHGRVMVIYSHPHDGACLIVECNKDDESYFFTCERSDLEATPDGESRWPYLGLDDEGKPL